MKKNLIIKYIKDIPTVIVNQKSKKEVKVKQRNTSETIKNGSKNL